MTDRELLEAAAKAAGIDLQTKTIFGRDAEPGYYLIADGTAPIWFWWNPLTDDGDALRLAVALRMNINIYSQGAEADCDTLESTCKESGDPYAATRRAIVRAAAAMKEKT